MYVFQMSCFFEVLYYAPSPVAAQKCVPHKGIMRAHIWYNIKGCDTSKISDYQPEDDGYKVLSIYRGIYV